MLCWFIVAGVLFGSCSCVYLLLRIYREFKSGTKGDNDYNNWINEQRN